jgi:hypothetical protein
MFPEVRLLLMDCRIATEADLPGEGCKNLGFGRTQPAGTSFTNVDKLYTVS